MNLVPTINNDGNYVLILTKTEYDELVYCVGFTNKKREYNRQQYYKRKEQVKEQTKEQVKEPLPLGRPRKEIISMPKIVIIPKNTTVLPEIGISEIGI